jgi:hypothetical protein
MNDSTYPHTTAEWHEYLDALPRPEVGPCPAWCERQGDHELMPTPGESGGIEWTRNHFTSWPTTEIDQLETITTDGVSIEAVESELAELEIHVSTIADTTLTAATARKMARDLLTAAERLDEITAAADAIGL